MAAKVLIIDDEEGVRKTLSLNLGMEGYEVESVEGADTALNLIDSGKNYDFIISDIRMPGTDGLQFLKEIKGRDLGSIVIMISAYGTVETSIEAIKCGASDYVNKPINTDELFLRMRMAEERERLRRENLLLRKGLGKDDGFEAIVFTSDKMGGVVDFVKRVSEYKTTVLITGESGTGKELIAHAIHARSPRKDGAFVAINCSAIPESLLESELFGYVKGAFSGASQSKRGLFEEANGGTLFLDEIGEFPIHLQSKLLRVLQEEEIRRLGDTKTIKVDVRIIAATSRDLNEDVKQGSFRGDLFYRLNVLPIHIPPLRERKDDIPILVDYFIKKYNGKLNRFVKGVSQQAMSELLQYPWYGNIRELENVVERAMILCDSNSLDRVNFNLKDNNIQGDAWFDSLSLDKAWQKLEKAYIEKALLESGGNRTQAAKLLGLSRRS
ncbi:MAG: histidine kinase, partial [Candidatus Dadabacteria bacterium RBG_19FT_COMBO_40_33]